MHSHFRSALLVHGSSIIYRFLPGPVPISANDTDPRRPVHRRSTFFPFQSILERLRPLPRAIQTGGASLRVVISYCFERIAIHIANPERSSFARFRVMARGIREARKQLTSFLSIDVADTFSYRTISNREYPKVIKLRENLYFFSFFLYIHIYIHTYIYIFSRQLSASSRLRFICCQTTSTRNFLLKIFDV